MLTTSLHRFIFSAQLFLLWAAVLPGLLVFNHAVADDSVEQKAVLVTGASSGIGRAIAERLAADGHFVYAGARKQADIDALNLIENIKAVRLDVTSQSEIDSAVAMVKAGGRGLWGVVNNAGVGVIGPLIEVDEKDLAFQLDVNVYGPYRVTKAFAPMILESKGRVTTIGSISGILTRPVYGPYSISKHAIEAYTDALAAELAPLGVGVSIIDPGGYKSAIRKNSLKRINAEQYTGEGSLFEPQIKAAINRFGASEEQYGDPAQVADAAVHALFDPKPLRRYLVVPVEGQARATISGIMREMIQLNQWHAYSYSRAELIEMLDELLAK